jgi:hypothetical protein
LAWHTRRFTALIVPPVAGATIAPPPAAGFVEDLSAGCRRVKPG